MNYKLVEVDPTPGGNGLSDSRKTVAIGSYDDLTAYCVMKYGKLTGKQKDMWAVWYDIEETDVVIVTHALLVTDLTKKK